MMQLVRISLVQWHLFGREDMDLSGDAAILGKNRSGKSTLIDLIQAVMTGGSGRWHRFNRSAGETGGSRSERTLRGYCLGQLNEHEYLREQAVTHIALVFDDPAGAKPPVSLGLCIEASTVEDAQVVGRWIAPGVRVHTDMLVEVLGNGHQRSAPWSVARDRLERACRERNGDLLRSENARNHVREYMRLLFTGRRHSDPERFIRAFVMALSFEDMRSVEGFVHNFLLEKDDIDIGELRDSIGRYRDIQKDIHDLERKLNALRHMRDLVVDFVAWLEKEELARDLERLAKFIEAGAALISHLRELAANRSELQDVLNEIREHEDELSRMEGERESLEAQINAQGAAAQRALLISEMKVIDGKRAAFSSILQTRFLTIARGAAILEHRERLAPLKLGNLFQALEAAQERSAGLHPPDWPVDPYEMEELIAAVQKAALADLPKIQGRRDDAIAKRSEHQRNVRDLRERLGAARQGRVALDERTTRLMAQLEREGMRPRALSQVAEIVDGGWREAAEALLGRDREAILVDSDHASRAVEVLRAGRDSFRGCRVVNTRRLADRGERPQPGTLASVFASEDPLAMAFITFRTGNVRLAESQAELLGDGRAIMRDGAYNSGVVVEVLRTADLKIGRAAAPLMEASLAQQIEEQLRIAAHHDEVQRFHDDVGRRVEALTDKVGEDARLEQLVLELERLEEQRLDHQRRLDRIAATIDPKLQADLNRVKVQIRELTTDKEELIGRRERLKQVVLNIGRQLDAGDAQPGSWISFSNRRRLFRNRVGSRARLKELRNPYRDMRHKGLARLAADLAKQADEARERYREREGEIKEALGHYRTQFDSTAPVALQGQIISEVKPWVVSNLGALEANELIQYRRQADEAAEQIKLLFRTAFVHELNARFSKMRNELDNLTRALKTRPLHNEIYSLHARPKEELAALHRLARESEEDETVFDALFGRGTPRDEEHGRALAEVERLLGEDAVDFTAYQDYRNYFTFDLRMQDVEKGRQLSYDRRKGTASGAERQVPYYVVIGAALASIYHGARRQYDHADLGLGLAVFDEAFSKMDGPNQRTLLDFYDDIGLQVVIAAPSEKRNVVYENLDSIIDVFRHGDMATAESARIKRHTRDRMRAANPQHLTDAQLAATIEPRRSDAAE
jgi:energy-coupling factor transporter ATP-binding protein EcfA2